jgi:hypothetical protein
VEEADVGAANSTTRRLELIKELTPEIRAKHPLVSWKELNELVSAAVEMQLLYERYGHES